MAIPTIANNSPSLGSIAWGAFNIQLNGVTYSVGAGSTNQRWVWWKYNNGAPTIVGGPDIPTTLVDDDLVLFGNKNGIGVRVQSTNFVDGELLVDGSIFAEALSTNLINSQHIVTAGLDAGVIKFGEMHGDRIQANTITADKLSADAIDGKTVVGVTIDGGTITGGTVSTGYPGENRIVMLDNENAGSLNFETGHASQSKYGQLYAGYALIGAANSPYGYATFATPTFGDTGQRAAIHMSGTSADQTSGPTTTIQLSAAMVGTQRDMEVGRNLKTIGNITSGAAVIADAGLRNLAHSGGGSTNANINNGGYIIRASSTRESKTDVTELTFDEAKLSLAFRSVKFRWIPELDMGDDLQAGHIAEEVEEAGASLYVTHDEEGVVTGVTYGEITSAHSVLLRNLFERIEKLEAEQCTCSK